MRGLDLDSLKQQINSNEKAKILSMINVMRSMQPQAQIKELYNLYSLDHLYEWADGCPLSSSLKKQQLILDVYI